MFSSFSSHPENSKGRLYSEEDCRFRSIYGRDRDRIINCASFRRLQYKTQVFVNHEGDHYRTRMTHSLEVAQIARWIASGLGCNKDLAEVVSLAHDLGHTPFGHAGEDILNEKMQDFGGFSHNAHTLKIITKLEKSYVDFDGLNLSWEMIEGVVKHNGAIRDLSKVHEYIKQYNLLHDLDLKRSPSIEAQISAISDDIAYNNHDIEDGIRAGLFTPEELFDLPFIGIKFKEVLDKNPKIRLELLVSQTKRRMVNDMVLDVISNTQNNIKKHHIKTVDDVRDNQDFLVNFSDEMENAHQEIKKFLMKNMYRHPKINEMTKSAHKIISKLFDFFIANPENLPEYHRSSCNNPKEIAKKEMAVNVADYIAGMTDRFAIKQYENL